MKSITRSLIIVFLFLSTTVLKAADTLTLHPSAANGQDWDAVIASGDPTTNYGTHVEFMCDVWTCGSPCVIRSLINFNISSIPSNATITSATLYLYADPSNTDGISGSPTYGSADAGWVQRVTSSWSVTGVNWNNQPTTTTTNEVAVPQSVSTTENYTLNVTSLYQDILANGNNYGIELLHQQETSYYNSLIFGSSNNTDTNLHPKLKIAYTVPTGLNSLTKASDLINVYPNPVTDKIVFKTSITTDMSNYYVDIYDMLGDKVRTVQLYPYQTTISTSDMPRGIYLYRIINDLSVIKTGKLVLE